MVIFDEGRLPSFSQIRKVSYDIKASANYQLDKVQNYVDDMALGMPTGKQIALITLINVGGPQCN